MAAPVTIKGRWCLTEDRDRLVPEGHILGRWLWATDGDEREEEECVRLGYMKQAKAPANKQAKPARNKGY